MSSLAKSRPSSPAAEAEIGPAGTSSGGGLGRDQLKPIIAPRWVPWVFAAKTTVSGLLALVVAFAFNLDQPKWALLTVFIVAQPQSGLVLAKSFYRIIGTVIGAAGSLVLVALFAQEGVLFLGALAMWTGLCTFASKYARNFAAYSFVLSGYTAAIVGITGALDPGNAFSTAIARVTEISLGILTTATISHLVLPFSLADALRRAVAAARVDVATYAAALLTGSDTPAGHTKLFGQAIALENLRASAIFEDREIRDRSENLRHLDITMLRTIDVGHLLGRSLEWFERGRSVIEPALNEAFTRAAAAIDLWRGGKLDAPGLNRRLISASASLPLVRELSRQPSAPDEEVIRQATVIGRIREFFSALVAFAEAYDACRSPRHAALRPARFPVANDWQTALWAGLRAAVALLLVGTFWIFADWPSGVTATILATVVTARLATMEHTIQAAIGGTLVVVLAAVPSFILVEILLPNADTFPMFAFAVSPILFCCAYLMAHAKTAGLGFVAGLYFANTAGFQDRMAYDPVGFLNTSIALALAIATAGILLAIVGPDTPQAARRRFVRVARRAFARIVRRRPQIGLTEFETSISDALDQLYRRLRPDRAEDVAVIEAGVALLGAGRELIRVRDDGRPTPSKVEAEGEGVDFIASPETLPFDHARRAAQDASLMCLSELRDDTLGVAEVRAAAREMVAFAAIRDELERSGELLLEGKVKGAPVHAA